MAFHSKSCCQRSASRLPRRAARYTDSGAHPTALPAASRSALTTPPIDTLSPLAPDTAWHYEEVMSYVELNIKMVRLQGPGTHMKRSSIGQDPETHREVIPI